MEKFRVGIIGATGMVGQRFVLLTANHPWFTPVVLAASAHSAGKPYAEAIGEKWHMADPIPESVRSMVVMDAEADAEEIAKQVDFVFCAVNMKKDEIKALEERYAKLECPVVSNNSAHRHTPDVPMVVPEINADHIRIIDAQRKRLGTKRGFIAVKSNCSLQSYVPALSHSDEPPNLVTFSMNFPPSGNDDVRGDRAALAASSPVHPMPRCRILSCPQGRNFSENGNKFCFTFSIWYAILTK